VEKELRMNTKKTVLLPWILCVCAGLGLLAPLHFSLQAFGSGRSGTLSKPGRGFTYHNDRNESVPWSIHVGKLDRSNKDFELHTVLATDVIFDVNTLSEQMKVFPPTLGRPIAAINGDFYHNESGPYQGDPKGLQIMQGELLSAPSDWSCFWLDPEGNPHMTNVLSLFKVTWPDGVQTPIGLNEERMNGAAVLYTPRLGPSTRTTGGREFVLEADGDKPWLPLQVGETYSARVRLVRESGDTPISSNTMILSLSPQIIARVPALKPGSILTISTATTPDLKGCKTALGGGPALVRAGKPMQWHSNQIRHPRTAIGWSSSHIFLVEVDGRQRGLSVGMTFPELADYMVKLGCEEALNLDGGGSATFWLYGQVVNSPSEGRERETGNSLVVVRKPPPEPRIETHPNPD
jgi:hypothetical protein